MSFENSPRSSLCEPKARGVRYILMQCRTWHRLEVPGINVLLDLEQRSGNAQVVVGYQGETQSYTDY